MSSSNPSRGKRQSPQAKALEEKNRLILEVVPLAHSLKPRVIVAENVRQVLTLQVEYQGREGRVIDLLADGLSEYKVFPGVVNVADYGIPQVRSAPWWWLFIGTSRGSSI
jgi:DNA (cytosine-5)-methyltransferase 1